MYINTRVNIKILIWKNDAFKTLGSLCKYIFLLIFFTKIYLETVKRNYFFKLNVKININITKLKFKKFTFSIIQIKLKKFESLF